MLSANLAHLKRSGGVRIWRSVEAASSQAAREAARADAKARAAKKKNPLDAQLIELERLKVLVILE